MTHECCCVVTDTVHSCGQLATPGSAVVVDVAPDCPFAITVKEPLAFLTTESFA